MLNYYDLGLMQSWFEILRDFSGLPEVCGLKFGNLIAYAIVSTLELL
jgi:hypothetical protein